MKTDRVPKPPAISLSPDDVRDLRSLSADLERELLHSYEDFLFLDQRRVDEARWRPVKTFENVICYRERRSYKRLSGSLPRRPSQSGDDDHTLEIGPQAAMAANNKMPQLFASGTTNGTLDDVLFGGSFHDTRSLCARNLYTNEEFDGTAVLAVVDAPTQDDPFRFLGVIWHQRIFGPSSIIMSRDALMLAAIHESRLSNGERVAVMMLHSIQHPDAPERPNLAIVRADVSHVALFRQMESSRLDVYVTSVAEFKGSMTEAFTINEVTRVALHQTDLSEAAFRRKLVHRVRESQQRPTSKNSLTDQDLEDKCALCDKRASKLFSSSSSNCQICLQRICNKCSMTKELVIEGSRTLKPIDFCLACALETKDLPAAAVAREELLGRWSGELFSSCSSASTGSAD